MSTKRIKNRIVIRTESLRISIDTKAKVKIGKSSRNGKSRSQQAKKAADHDMEYDEILGTEVGCRNQ